MDASILSFFKGIQAVKRVAKAAALSSVVLAFIGCNQVEPQDTVTLPSADEIVMVTREGPATYYETMYGESGFEYNIAQQFAHAQGKKLRVITANSLQEIFNALNSGEAHIAAAGLTATADRSRLFHFSPSYMEIDQYVLYRYGTSRPRKAEKLVGRDITIMNGSSHQNSMLALTETYPDLNWKTVSNANVVDLMAMLQRGETEHIIVDSNDYDLHKSTFPGIGVAFALKRKDPLVWMMGPQQNNHFLASVDLFFDAIKTDGTLEELKERHYGHISHMRRTDAKAFARKVEETLPSVEELIKRVAIEEGVDWRLLAAVSYQESHWNPKARSPTGVRGLMMLTKVTAKEMGVTDRVDAEQSLRGGARYFLKTLSRMPDTIQEPDRTWMALASYNVGYGHLMDARKITQQQGGDPDVWRDVMERLPLLRKRAYYSKTRYGYARGDEPVNYVQRIRNYYQQLAWRERDEDIMLAMASSVNN